MIFFFIIAKNKKYNQIFFLYYLNLKVNALVCWSENFEDFLYVKTRILRYILALCRPSNQMKIKLIVNCMGFPFTFFPCMGIKMTEA